MAAPAPRQRTSGPGGSARPSTGGRAQERRAPFHPAATPPGSLRPPKSAVCLRPLLRPARTPPGCPIRRSSRQPRRRWESSGRTSDWPPVGSGARALDPERTASRPPTCSRSRARTRGTQCRGRRWTSLWAPCLLRRTESLPPAALHANRSDRSRNDPSDSRRIRCARRRATRPGCH